MADMTVDTTSFAPSNNKTNHCGQQQQFQIIPWDKWHRTYSPMTARYITFTRVSKSSMTDIREHHYAFSTTLTGSITSHLTNNQEIILLEAAWDDPSKAESFLTECIPIQKDQRFQDGIIGIGLGRWMKCILMSAITAPVDARDRFLGWFETLVRFVVGLQQNPHSHRWFDVILTTLRTNDAIEDILVMKLLQAALGVRTIPRIREFRWFEKSIEKAFGYNPELRHNVLTPLVWIIVWNMLHADIPFGQSVSSAFDLLQGQVGWTDSDVMRTLLGVMFPELVDHTDRILESIRKKERFGLEHTPILLSDGTTIPPLMEKLPMGIASLRSSIQMCRHTPAETMLSINLDEYNIYTPFYMDRIANTTIIITGTPIPTDHVNKHGAGVLFRGLRYPPRTTDAFRGIMGLSLAGGRGDGRTKPTEERMPAPVLSTTASSELAIVRMTPREYRVKTAGWSLELVMPFRMGDKVFAVFFKGIRDLQIRIVRDPGRPPVYGGGRVSFSQIRSPFNHLQTIAQL